MLEILGTRDASVNQSVWLSFSCEMKEPTHLVGFCEAHRDNGCESKVQIQDTISVTSMESSHIHV